MEKFSLSSMLEKEEAPSPIPSPRDLLTSPRDYIVSLNSIFSPRGLKKLNVVPPPLPKDSVGKTPGQLLANIGTLPVINLQDNALFL